MYRVYNEEKAFVSIAIHLKRKYVIWNLPSLLMLFWDSQLNLYAMWLITLQLQNK